MIFLIGILVIVIVMNVYLWKRRPHDGEIVITTNRDGRKVFSLELDKTPEEIEKMKRVSFKVVSHGSDNELVQLESDEFAD